MDLEKMLGEMARREGSDSRIVFGKEREEFTKSFVPLQLDPGDRVRWKKGMRDSKLPNEGEVVEVFRTFPPIEVHDSQFGNNHYFDRVDFSILANSERGTYYEVAMDSRRFEKVE